MAKPTTDTFASTGPEMASPDRSDQISRRAYDLFLARGGEHGRDLDDWAQAERELGDGSGDRDDRGATEA
jgi:hypothetical protein